VWITIAITLYVLGAVQTDACRMLLGFNSGGSLIVEVCVRVMLAVLWPCVIVCAIVVTGWSRFKRRAAK